MKEPRGESSIFLFTKGINLLVFGKSTTHNIHVGFYYDEKGKKLITDTKQKIFCFFPTKETFNTCFISHAPFLLTDNRQNLKPDEPINATLTEAIANLATRSVVFLRDYGITHQNLLINENITEIVPNYKTSFWESLDPILEEPIYNAFNRLLEVEKILISRNDEYLFLSNSYIGAPKELVELLSKKQFNSLRGESNKLDFLKWELVQNISKSKLEVLEDIEQYTSEDFAEDITSEFMVQQDFRWIIKMYNFLRSNAPKLWKTFGLDKGRSLPFRHSPIIKTQKNEWVTPYKENGEPNVYFPIKEDNSSDYNFIHQDYISNEMARKFFIEMDIKQPDELDYIRNVIFEKFDEDSIDNNEIISDLCVLIDYYKKNSKNTDFIEQLKEKILFVGDSKDEDGECQLMAPGELFIPDDNLKKYFNIIADVQFINIEFYKKVIEKYDLVTFYEFVTLLGVKNHPVIKKVPRPDTRCLNDSVRKSISDIDATIVNIIDYELEFFNEVLYTISKDTSIYVWNKVLSLYKLPLYQNLEYQYRRKHARHLDSGFTISTFKKLLQQKKWIFDEKGKAYSALEIPLENLAPEYDRSNGVIQFLGIEKKQKTIIELGGTIEQQNQMDFGKRIIDIIGGELSEQEAIQLLSDATAQKKMLKEQIRISTQPKREGSPNDQTDAESNDIEDKLNKKWDEKAKEKIGRPSHIGNSGNITSNDIINNDKKQLDDSYQPFFSSSKYDSNKEDTSVRNNSKAEKNIKSRDTEAQESAQAAHEQVQILELLESTETYTFKWYKLLMELMHANKSLKTDRHIQIDFSEWEMQCSNKILHLSNPSAPIPSWLTDSDQYVLNSLGPKSEKIDGIIIKSNEYSVDISIEDIVLIKDICNKTKKIRLIADNSTNIIDSLEKRFLQLGFEDDYNLNDNLPQDIKFIYGPPGTGKTTTLVNDIHDILNRATDKTNILVLTPTNKAADVIAEKMVEDDICFDFLSRFGATEKLDLIEDAAVVTNRDAMDMDLLPNNIVVTTAARYTYDYLQPDNTFLCDYNWDYIFVDEASMVDLVSITYILYKGASSHIVVAGDPKQIEPVSQNDMPTYNVYDLVGLQGFADAINNYKRYPVKSLTIQYRSIPSIGEVVSQFAYNGIVKPDPNRKPQKPLSLKGIGINDINFLGFEIIDLDLVKGLTSVGGSAFHLYSAIFTYNFAEYIVKQIEQNKLGSDYSIGIVCPYRAQADAIKQMIDNRPIASDSCSVTCGTVHSFQGDECDIMLIVLNPPLNCSQGSHINNQNIINVAMSRARDYMFFILPKGQTPGFTIKNELGKLAKNKSILMCSDIENVMLESPNFIAANTHVTCHMPVNVYCEDNAQYEVRMSDTAIDIKINR